MPSASAGKLWKTAPCDAAISARLAGELNLPLPAAMLLASRGFVEPAQIENFLSPRLSQLSDPFLLPGAELAANRIWQSIDRGENIVVFGDYDVDGITAAALVIKVLKALGAKVVPFLPHRLDEGYGLSVDGLHRCVETHHPKLIVTVDCGTGSVEAVEKAKESGIDVIVTDHHTPSGPIAPAVAVVNPKLGKETALHSLAGVGVAFKLCHALIKVRREAGNAINLKDLLGLVSLGTISDIVPLTGENRILTRHGLDELNRTKSVGLRALAEKAGIQGEIDTYEVGFRLGPRLNAAGRLGDALKSLDLLLTDAPALAGELASQLDASNRERQDIERRIVDEAFAELDASFDAARDFGLVVAKEGWHPGVIGIVASRIVQRYYRPVVCIALDGESGRGSCRSIEGFDMVAGLGKCGKHLTKFGGHSMAAGLELASGSLKEFSKAFNRVTADELRASDLRPVQKVDAWLELRAADDLLLESMERMKPFGFGNPTPVWAAKGLRVVGAPRTIGKGHLKMNLAHGGAQREAIGWGMAEREIPSGEMDVAFQLKRDTYMGNSKIVLTIQDFRATQLAP